MTNQTSSITGELMSIQEAKNKKGELYYKLKIAYGDQEYTFNSDKRKPEWELGNRISVAYTESEYEMNGQTYKSKWVVDVPVTVAETTQDPAQTMNGGQNVEAMFQAIIKRLDEIDKKLDGPTEITGSAPIQISADDLNEIFPDGAR